MSDPFSRIMQLGDQAEPELTPVDGNDPFAHMTGTATQINPPASFDIDFSQDKAAVRKQIAKLPKGQRKAAMKQWADVFVAKERKENKGFVQDATDVVRNLTRGTVVGSFLDEANALTASATGQAPYEEALAYQRAQDRAIDKDSTKLGTLPVIGDVTAGGVTKLAGGILSAPATPMINAMRGAALAPRIANGALTGGLYGLIYGAGAGEGAENRLMTGGLGLAAGVVGGGAIPIAAEGVGRAVNAVRSAAPTPQALRSYHPGAVKRVQRSFNDDLDTASGMSREATPVNGWTLQSPGADRRYAVRAGNLGDEGMLADMGPNMQNQAGAIASMPGAGQTKISGILRSRADGSQGRINQSVDAALGPRRNLVAAEEVTIQAARKNAAPLYDQFYNTAIEMTPRLAGMLRRADAAGAMKRVAKLIKIEGISPDQLANNGRLIDLVKRAVDDMASSAQRTGENNLHRIYSGLSRAIRKEVDTALSPSDPTKSIWAQARRAAGEGKQFSEGLEAGQAAFAKNLSPDQMKADLGGATPVGQTAYKMGARGQIGEVTGNAATKFGENASAKGRTLLGSENARRKINMLTDDPSKSRDLVRRLDAEASFDATYQNVLQNSKTASRQAAQKEFPAPSDGAGAANEVGKKTFTGLTMEAGYRALNGLLMGALNERRISIARDAADMLLQRGVNREKIAQALLKRARAQNVSGERMRAVNNLVEHILRGSGPQAVSHLPGVAE